MLSRSLAVPLVALAAVSGAKDVRVSGGNAALTLDRDTADALIADGITVRPVGRARTTKAGFALPITYGRLKPRAYTGTLRSNGGLRLTRGGRQVDLNNVRLNLDGSPDLTAELGTGKRISFARVDLSDAQTAITSRRFSVSDAAITLNAAGAEALDDALGTDVLASRDPLGTADVDTRIRR